MLKIATERKKLKTMGPLSQEWIDGRYWSPDLACHANQSNEYYINYTAIGNLQSSGYTKLINGCRKFTI